MTERRAHISRWTWARVMAAYGFACAACREPFSDGARVDIDHIWQRATGGPDAADNYRPLCTDCHSRKSARDANARAKIRRLTGVTGNGPKRKINGRRDIPKHTDPWGKRRRMNEART
jgi:5-methylcytosine-specific restriction endonuclease McrA